MQRPPAVCLRRCLCACLCLYLCLAAVFGAAAQPGLLQPFGAADGPAAAPWHVVGLPQQRKPYTQFAVVEVDGRRALRVEARASYGNLVHPLQLDAGAGQLSWQWRIDQPLEGVDLRSRSGDDTALKVCVLFDLPLERVPFVERQLLRAARAASAAPLPGATVCYVWDAKLAAGTVLDNAYTRRLRYIVVRSGPQDGREWMAERRDVAADFRRAFGAESPQLPPIVGIGVGADADNTGGHSIAHLSALRLEP